jgi:sialate O-acetylesterase
VAFGFAYFLNKKIHVPIGIIQTSWGSAYIEGWMPIELTKKLPHFKKSVDRVKSDKDLMKAIKLVMEQFEKHGKIGSQYYDDPQKDKELKKILAHKPGYTDNANVFARTQPNLLYNAMLHPFIPYAVRGMVWYQGEANAENWQDATQYAESLQLWTKALRKIWGNKNFYMLGVMLPGFGKMMGGSPKPKDLDYPGNVTWAYMRESQMKLLSLPHTGVANTVDLGDAQNIHPHDKKPLCERLARIAARYVYGQKIVAVGPIFSKYKVKGNKFYVKFTHAKGLKTTDGEPPKGFWLTDKEHKEWYPAKARIIGDVVELTSDKVPNPAACRYAFAAKPTVNLVNGAGLPAYPFRTDKWNPYDKK